MKKDLRKSPLHKIIATKGKISFEQHHIFLSKVWEEFPDLRELLIKTGVANMDGILDIKEITLDDANRAIEAVNFENNIQGLYEINYLKSEPIKRNVKTKKDLLDVKKN